MQTPFPAPPSSDDTAKPEIPKPATHDSTPYLRIAHVLFMDIVGYSRLPLQAQSGVQIALQKVVQAVSEVQKAQARKEDLVIRPSGDGMALLFFSDLLSPVRCAIEITDLLHATEAEIRTQTGTLIRLRMGINTGPVLMTEDLNRQTDVAGEGIVLAQRIMDCGDAGHILLSDRVAKAISGIDPYKRFLNDLGTVGVKHGVRIHVHSLYGRTIGVKVPFGSVLPPLKIAQDSAERRTLQEKRTQTLKELDAEDYARPWLNSLQMFLCLFIIVGLVGGIWRLVSPGTTDEVFSQRLAIIISAPKRSFAWPASWLAPHSAAQGKTASGGVSGGTASSQGKTPSQGVGYQYRDGRAAAGDAARSGKSARPASGANPASGTRELWPVPDFSNRTLDELARDSEGFKIVRSENSDWNDKPEGQVYRQDPSPGSMHRFGTKIYVRVSKGPRTVQDPLPAVQETRSSSYTGILIIATGSHFAKFNPDAYTVLVGAASFDALYPESTEGAETNDDKNLPIGFCTNRAEAERVRCGKNPLVLHAESVVAPHGLPNSLRLSDAEAARFTENAAALNLSQTHNVGILYDSGK